MIYGQQNSWSGKAVAAGLANFAETHGAGGDACKFLADQLA